MATLKELAESTGYAQATISRILSGDPSLTVSPETRKLVLEEAGRLNYTATRSRRGRTPKGLLRIGMAEMLTPTQQLEDPYYLYLSGFVRQTCLDKKFTCIPLNQQGEQFSPPEGDKLDGIVAIGIFSPTMVQSLESICPNVVFLDSSPQESQFDAVVLNYSLGISLALEHLFALNHREIGFVGPTFKLDDRRQRALEVRKQLFLQQMTKAELLQEDYLLDCPMSAESAATAVTDFLQTHKNCPTAFLCANEESAIGTVRALISHGKQVPQDVSVVSFNDTPRSALVEPPLTSVSAHVEEMARTALRLLAERSSVGGADPVRALPLKVVVPPSLTVRTTADKAKTPK
ncbi:MAG: LacI family DNA-binding transcriptional regulator [Eubacteriales bacterium]